MVCEYGQVSDSLQALTSGTSEASPRDRERTQRTVKDVTSPRSLTPHPVISGTTAVVETISNREVAVRLPQCRLRRR